MPLVLVMSKLFIAFSAYSFVSLVAGEQFVFPCMPAELCHQRCHVKAGEVWAAWKEELRLDFRWKQMIKNERGSRYTKSPRIAETTAKKQKWTALKVNAVSLKLELKKERGNISLRCFFLSAFLTLWGVIFHRIPIITRKEFDFSKFIFYHSTDGKRILKM